MLNFSSNSILCDGFTRLDIRISNNLFPVFTYTMPRLRNVKNYFPSVKQFRKDTPGPFWRGFALIGNKHEWLKPGRLISKKNNDILSNLIQSSTLRLRLQIDRDLNICEVTSSICQEGLRPDQLVATTFQAETSSDRSEEQDRRNIVFITRLPRFDI